MIINHNISALNTYRQLTVNNNSTSKALEKLSSGLRINRAGDDAAGLAISEKMRGQIRGLEMASKNAQDGISLIQTAEGALNETHAILQRMRELAVQSANDTNNDNDRAELQKEVDQLVEELTRIANNTEFNTKNLLDGTFQGTFHIGANEGQNLALSIDAMDAVTLGVGVSVLTEGKAEVDGIADQDVLLDGNGNAVAAKVGTDWYAIGDVQNDGGGTPALEAKADTVPLTITDVGSIKGQSGLYNVGKATVDGVSDVDVLLDSNGNAVAAKVGSDWYAIDNVQDDGSGTLVAIGGAPTLNVVEGKIIGENLGAGIDISSQESADKAITVIQKAIDTVSAERSKLGAYQNRLEHTINNLGTSAENLTAAESRIRDVDMAKEMMEFTKNSILSQAAQAMLAQANQMPQGVLQLLR